MDMSQARTRLHTGEEAENATAMALPANGNRFQPARIIAKSSKKTTQKWRKELAAARLREVRYLAAAMYDALDAVDLQKAIGLLRGIRYLTIEAQQLLEKEASCS